MIVQFKDSGAENGSGSTTDVENNNAPANWGLTYTCDMANSITDGTALQIGVPTAIFLTPETINTIGCPTVPQLHTFILLNFTGAAGTFYLSYNVTTSNGSATGPVNV